MRSTLFLAVASALVASVSAHEGPHDPPTTTPSVCMTTPTDASCSTYNVPNATVNAAISDICKASSFLPGCSLNVACTADSTLPAANCAPLTILATLCTAADDAALTTAVCSKTYSVFCATNSLIPACKSQAAFPGLPSGKAITGAVYSICQSMPGMTDCKICPGPDATGYSKCDEVKAWSGLCLDMPDMNECPPFNTMCTNTKFAPFCSNSYKAPAASNGTASATASGSTPTPTGGDHSGHNGAGVVGGSLTMVSALAAVAAAVSALIL
ncbi:hypothetical protein BGX28_005312 [Mortierella sp. GBA30]|nr:hypothetical protein BGX28_005312 [Mortierella sp. GBA30]